MAYTDIDNPELYFQTKTYTGNGSTQSITLDGSENMQPDWVWIKERNTTVSHQVFDVIRGATKRIYPNDTSAEDTNANSLTAFDSDGFSLGNAGSTNGNSDTYVSWNWKAGGSASSNSNGSITSSVSANTTAGFSIVSYTGTSANATVGHGLGVAPSLMIIKARQAANSEAQHWIVYHQSLGNTSYVWLNRTLATGSATIAWQDTSPTSTVFSIGDWTPQNYNSVGYISYCFAEKKGYSKFGTYQGNGNADGTFVHLGFKPAWVIIKRTDSTSDWSIQDNKRDTFNPVDTSLFSNTNDTDTTSSSYNTDFLSNGFKLRGTSAARNGDGNTYIYWAFAESPFTNSSGVPNNAR